MKLEDPRLRGSERESYAIEFVSKSLH
jgi:hypothetical protein